MFLDRNSKEYEKYFAWRSARDAFHGFLPSFLTHVAKHVVGPLEMKAVRQFHNPKRAAACCRLCNLKEERAMSVVDHPWDWNRIQQTFFQHE